MVEAGAEGSAAAGSAAAGWAEAGWAVAVGWAEEAAAAEDSAVAGLAAEDLEEVMAVAGWVEKAAKAACIAHASVHIERHAGGAAGTHMGGGLAILSAVICEKPTLPVLTIPMTRVIVMFTCPGVPETATVTGVFAEATL